MLLSVIIPAYNAGQYLADAVRSVLHCGCIVPEVIVIDDGSRDGTGTVADRLALEYPSLRVVHTENRGAARARNLGLDIAAGDYVAFLDADDLWCTNALDEAVREHLSAGRYDLLSFGYFNAEPGLRFGRPIPEISGHLTREDPGYDRAASRKSFCSYLYRRTLLDGIRFPEGIRYNEDTTFLFLASRRAKNLLQLDRFLFLYRNHIHSAMHTCDGWDYILTDEIPAWAWARQQVCRESDRLVCDGMVYQLMGQYLRFSARWGVPCRRLQEEMKNCLPFQDALRRFGTFWADPGTVQFLQHFSREPVQLCRRCRIQGFGLRAARALSRNRYLRQLYFLAKYRTPLKPYLPAPDVRR